MTLRVRASRQQAGESFPEAVAQWRLTLRTEVKTTSSLPTSVFHARDATLEAMLAASTEAMLARLQTPSRAANARAAVSPGQRLERIGVAELQALPTLLRAGGDRPPRIDDHARTEAIGVLADAALGADEAAAATAAGLLQECFGIGAGGDRDADAAQLRRYLSAALPADAAGGQALAAIARAVVDAVAARTAANPAPA
ncbi:MAG: hypothetical protein FJ306_14780 [Planctomycetes bacterium]|nr:hypothetical protein [Planctomycetota bacterium]